MFQELSDKIATREVIKVLGDEVRLRLDDLGNGMTDLSGLVKDLPEQHSAQASLLEENLAAALVAALRDDNQKHFDTIVDNLFEMENKLHGIKKLVKKGGGEEAEDIGLKTVMDRVEGVSQRLENVQGVLENSLGGEGGAGGGLDTALLLAEIRKRSETTSQEMYKAVHNVQRRLLEEHVSKLFLCASRAFYELAIFLEKMQIS